MVRTVSSVFAPTVPQLPPPPEPAPEPAPTLTQAARAPEPKQATRVTQATRAATNTERRVAAAQGQPNLTNVLAQTNEQEPGARARRRALGV